MWRCTILGVYFTPIEKRTHYCMLMNLKKAYTNTRSRKQVHDDKAICKRKNRPTITCLLSFVLTIDIFFEDQLRRYHRTFTNSQVE